MWVLALLPDGGGPVSAQEAMAKLSGYAADLDKRSRELGQVQRELDPVLDGYADFVESFEADLYRKCEADGTKLPSESLRLILARQEMPEEFRKQHDLLLRRRERLKQRISDLKAAVEAQRSILSAEKAEMEAIGA